MPEFFTYIGFQHDFIDRLADIADRVKRDRWVLGAAGDQPALSDQYNNLPDDLLALYTPDFISTWQTALNKLRLRKLTGDKPQYIALSAISAPTSPLTQLIESISCGDRTDARANEHRKARAPRRFRKARNPRCWRQAHGRNRAGNTFQGSGSCSRSRD